MSANPEMDRILALPVRSRDPGCSGTLLRPAQHLALDEFCHALEHTTDDGPPGAAILAGPGVGKTLVSLLMPALAEHPRTLHLVPSALVPQLHDDVATWRDRLPDVDSPNRVILSHESLSAPSGRHALDEHRPELVIIDEAHGFADPNSARWRRVVEYLAGYPDCRLVVLSGTLSWRELKQARHLLAACLRGWCPLPTDSTFDAWSACIDVGGEPAAEDRRVVRPLVDVFGPPHRTVDPRVLARTAYQRRLRTCPGVVVTGGDAADVRVGLTVEAWRPEPSPAVAKAVVDLNAAWVLPDGTELVHATEVHRHGRTLALGCYIRWDPGTVDPAAVEARRRWGGELRSLVAYQGHRYQTPAVACAAGAAGALPWAAQRAYDAFDAYPADAWPETELVWVDHSAAYTLAMDTYGTWTHDGLLWTQTPAIGKAVADVLDVRYHGAGDPAPDGRHTAVASLRVFGKGWNGQAFHDVAVLEPPSSGATWEQLLARQHRPGQTQDVHVRVLWRDKVHHASMGSALADARYAVETTGVDQRLLTCNAVGWSRTVTGSHEHANPPAPGVTKR